MFTRDVDLLPPDSGNDIQHVHLGSHVTRTPVKDYEWPVHFQPDVVRSGFRGGRLTSYCLALEAWRRGLDVSFLGPDALRIEVSDGTTCVRFDRSRSDRITPDAYNLVEDKYRTSARLRDEGVPVPEAYLFEVKTTHPDEVRQAAHALGFPVVLKPRRGSLGKGVFANISDPGQLMDSYRHLVEELGETQLVLERHHFGLDFRVYVVGDNYVAACKRIPANVVGDGKSTVDQLITSKNSVRRNNPFLAGGLIKKDYEVREMVSRAGYTLASIPGPGEHVALRSKANASAGGDVVDVTDELPERIRVAAVAAVQAVPGLPAAGVDVLWNEAASANGSEDFVVIEMNSRAHIGVNMYPTQGKGQDVPKFVIDEYFPETPRREDDAFANLTFDRKDIAEILLSGVPRRLTLNPAPDHGYPIRQLYTLSPGRTLSRRQRISLAAAARRADVACEIRLAGEPPELMLGAKDSASLRRFYDALSNTLGEAPTAVENWSRPLYAGFRVV